MSDEKTIIKEKFLRSISVCEIHIERLDYALRQIDKLFPLTESNYSLLTNKTIQAIDQFIFRFTKLQDEMGTKTFRLLLECLGEDIEKKPFIDILVLLERYEIIDNEETWFVIREIRNELTHEYPQMVNDTINALNGLFRNREGIITIFHRIKSRANKYNLL